MVAEKQQNDRLCIAVVLDLGFYNLEKKKKKEFFILNEEKDSFVASM